jgi:hypothetical protein
VRTFAGTGAGGGLAEPKDGPGPGAVFVAPADLAFDAAGDLVVADGGAYALRRVSFGPTFFQAP